MLSSSKQFNFSVVYFNVLHVKSYCLYSFYLLEPCINCCCGFFVHRDINGLTLCVKMGSVPSVEMHTDTSSVPASGSSAVCSVYAPYTARSD